MSVKKSSQLTLRDLLSRLTLPQAAKWLGADGGRLLRETGSEGLELSPEHTSWLGQNSFQLIIPRAAEPPVVVTLKRDPAGRDGVAWACSEREQSLPWVAETLSFVLEEKSSLGLAEVPPETHVLPMELLDEKALVERALQDREKRAVAEKMVITQAVKTAQGPWTDYLVKSLLSGRTWRVAFRGMDRGNSFCACPDFRKNTLGTCKHVIKVTAWVKKRFPARELAIGWTPDRFALHLRYDGECRLALEIPGSLAKPVAKLVAPWIGLDARTQEETLALHALVPQLEKLGEPVTIFPDAEERIGQALHQRRLSALVAEIRKKPAAHPLRSSLLKTELLPYQLDGIAFAAGAGRAILADEMGLGKTIQGVGVAEFLARQSGISRVLIVCPASLKSQWASEIGRFSGRSVGLVVGAQAARGAQYEGVSFFTVCNYEQVLRDYLHIERTTWDLIILDEAQRIKNWEAKTSRVIKSLRSRFALVLTGTPVENRLDDLFSIMEFIDDQRLGPAFRFLNRHRVATETGKVTGYRNLTSLRARLAPVLLRRTRASVALDLPPRATELLRVTPTAEQAGIHGAQMLTVASILKKKFLTEMDLLRLRSALTAARMAADSTYLVDKKTPSFSSKLTRLAELLASLIAEPERKILLFSEWTTMLNLIEPILKDLGAGFVRLDGKVPQSKRKLLVHEFQTKPKCRVFLTTNAGSTGLNLQAADTVINVDLPWNPALLEQRIARAHRMGQKRKVHVYVLVTEGTIEEGLLATLSAKHELANAALDPDSDINEVELHSGTEELKRRLEILLGARAAATPDVSAEQQAAAEAAALAEKTSRRERVAEAGGQVLSAAFGFLGQLLPQSDQPNPAVTHALREKLLECVETGEDGRPRLTVTLPSTDALTALAESLARLIGTGVK